MKPEQVLDYFGSQAAIARALDMAQPSVFAWFKNGRVPDMAQLRIEEATQGKLLADPGIPRGWRCQQQEQASV